MIKVGIMQPYFMPYIGYFQLMKAVDKYVVYDDVNYIKGGWVCRNYILENGEKKMFTITLKGASPNKLFNEIEIGDNFKKFKKTLQMNYSKAPYFESTMQLIDRIISYPNKQLALFIANSFREILSYLNINTKIYISSDLHKDCTLKGKDKVIHICKLLGGDVYYNAIGGKELYDKDEFVKNGVSLSFLKTDTIDYPQFNGTFEPYLSLIDVLMFNSVEDTNVLLDRFILV